MPEPGDLLAPSPGADTLFRGRGAWPWSPRATVIAGATAVATATMATLVWAPSPILVWNASASAPIGLYRVSASREAVRSDMVIAWPPDAARRLGAERHYLPANVPLVKRVAGTAGDRVCAEGRVVTVNGRLAAVRRSEDLRGRPLPWWRGCEVLRPGDLFLLTADVPQAFDGRYFGVTRRGQIIGRARLLWRR